MNFENVLQIKGKDYFLGNEGIFINRVGVGHSYQYQHKHDFIEIAYIEEGSGVHTINGIEYEVNAGDVCIINTNTPHCFIANDTMMVYNCIFKPEFIDYSLITSTDFATITRSLLFDTFFIEDSTFINVQPPKDELLEIDNLYKKMLTEYTQEKKGNFNILRSSVIELITRLFRIVETKSNSIVQNYKVNIFNKATKFVKENIAENSLSATMVAKQLYLSRSHFCRLFKDMAGQTFLEYLQELRIGYACNLLKNTNRMVSQIIYECGFKDPKHFNKLFKKLKNTTPSKYRKESNN